MDLRTYEQVKKSFGLVLKRVCKQEKIGILQITPNLFWKHAGDLITEWEVRKFGGFSKFYQEHTKKKEEHPLADFTRDGIGSIIKEKNHKSGTFFITAAAPVSHLDWTDDQVLKANNNENIIGSNLHTEAFSAVKNFLKRKNAELVILPMPAHVKALQSQPTHYDPALREFIGCFATEYSFNRHLKAIEAYINPQQINPLTGIKRLRIHKFGPHGEQGSEIKRFKTSIIVAHSKQMMEVVPTSNSGHPRIIHSTGAITRPSYLRNRIGMIANEDHKLGGIVVEVDGDAFYLRQVQFDPKNGSFVDLGVRYHANGTATPERAEAFVMGDLHPGYEDQGALNAMYDLWEEIQPKRVFFHDFLDGQSISHHLVNKRLSKAKNPSVFRTLDAEFSMAKKVIGEICDKAPKDAELIATASNHPEHIMRYLEEGRYINDVAENYNLAHRLVVMALDGKNPVQEILDPNGRMKWTEENEDYIVEGVQLNAHGHLGINGSRGGKAGHELAYGDCMVAHSHTPNIYHNAFTVGHMSSDRHGYNNGPSTWIRCSGAIYKGGQKQLYMFINNKYKRSSSSFLKRLAKKK